MIFHQKFEPDGFPTAYVTGVYIAYTDSSEKVGTTAQDFPVTLYDVAESGPGSYQITPAARTFINHDERAELQVLNENWEPDVLDVYDEGSRVDFDQPYLVLNGRFMISASILSFNTSTGTYADDTVGLAFVRARNLCDPDSATDFVGLILRQSTYNIPTFPTTLRNLYGWRFYRTFYNDTKDFTGPVMVPILSQPAVSREGAYRLSAVGLDLYAHYPTTPPWQAPP
ncbi:MAG: hypothetical protein LW884_05860 [Bacteroidetes bacterium]|jgi:hypothetical protein|nr:hypothetical protein [Bacteroidota bacterium]